MNPAISEGVCINKHAFQVLRLFVVFLLYTEIEHAGWRK